MYFQIYISICVLKTIYSYWSVGQVMKFQVFMQTAEYAREWFKILSLDEAGPFCYVSQLRFLSASDFLGLNLMLTPFRQKMDLKTMRNAPLYFPKASSAQ